MPSLQLPLPHEYLLLFHGDILTLQLLGTIFFLTGQLGFYILDAKDN
jgi:hypothetical protein